MLCSGCGKDIPFTGSVCPYCQRDKSKDQNYMVLGTVFGLGLALLGGSIYGVVGAIGGFILGAVIAYKMSGAGKTKAPEVQVKDAVDGSNEAKLKHLKSLFDKGLIDETDYNQKKKDILDTL